MDYSILILAFNGESYIREQIVSILRCVSANDVEIIVVDDASTDKTHEICLEFADRLTILKNKKNFGIKRSLIRGLTFVKTKYVFLSDQDDIWKQNQIADMRSYLAPDTLVFSDFEIFPPHKKHSLVGMKEKFVFNKDCDQAYIRFNSLILGCTMAFDVDFFKKYEQALLDIKFSAISHDDFISSVFVKYGKVISVPQKLIRYRIHDRQYSRSTSIYRIKKEIVAREYVDENFLTLLTNIRYLRVREQHRLKRYLRILVDLIHAIFNPYKL